MFYLILKGSIEPPFGPKKRFYGTQVKRVLRTTGRVYQTFRIEPPPSFQVILFRAFLLKPLSHRLGRPSSGSSFRGRAMGSQHPSPNVKTICNFEPQIWLAMLTSRDMPKGHVS